MSSTDIKFYISIFVRRLPYFIAIVVCATAGGIGLAYILPPVYQADAKILVESPQISTDLARSTVPEEIAKQIQRIELQMMTRENLLVLARRSGLYRDRTDLSADDIANEMRLNTKVEPVELNTWTKTGATGLSISYKASDPVLAANVVNEFAELVVQRNVNLRTNQASDTLRFFQQEVERHAKRLQDIEGEIVAFKNEHRDTLPENLAFRQSQLMNLQEKLSQLEREEAVLRDERSRVAQMMLMGTDGRTGALSLKEQTLEQFRRVLIDKRAIYSETSPAILAIQSQISSLEKEIEQERSNSNDEATKKRTPTEMDLRLADVSRKLAFIPQEKEAIKKRLTDLNDSISRAPATETALKALDREYQNVQAQYNLATTRLADASVGQQIESRSKGERLSILEEALPPRYPIQPKRGLIALGGLAFGIALGAGFIFLLELLGKAVRRPVDLISKLDIEPLVTIPYIESGAGHSHDKSRAALALAILASGLSTLPLLASEGHSADALQIFQASNFGVNRMS